MGVHYTSYKIEHQDDDHIPPPVEHKAPEHFSSHILPAFSTPPSLAGPSSGSSDTRPRTMTAKRLTVLSSPELKRQSATYGQLESMEKNGNGHTPCTASTAALPTSASSSSSPYARPYEVSRVVGPDCYYMGIIDFQQQWTWSKRLERQVKILFKGADADGLSAMPPQQYMQRFIDHMEDLLDLGDLDPDVDRRTPRADVNAQSVLHL